MDFQNCIVLCVGMWISRTVLHCAWVCGFPEMYYTVCEYVDFQNCIPLWVGLVDFHNCVTVCGYVISRTVLYCVWICGFPELYCTVCGYVDFQNCIVLYVVLWIALDSDSFGNFSNAVGYPLTAFRKILKWHELLVEIFILLF